MALNILTGLATNIDTVLSELDTIGFFRYILPLMLIFAIIFAILSKMEILKDKKGINFIISISIALIAITNPVVSDFFSVLFPKLGQGISILLIAMILIGVFVPLWQEKTQDGWGWGNYIFMGIGILIFLVATFSSLSTIGFAGSWWWDRYMGAIIVLLIIVGAIIAVMTAGKSDSGGAGATGATHH